MMIMITMMMITMTMTAIITTDEDDGDDKSDVPRIWNIIDPYNSAIALYSAICFQILETLQI